ncbi:MAG: YdcF family protein, partial [Steroidobacteraceae bacterium]
NTEGEARAIAKMLMPAPAPVPAQSDPKPVQIILVTSAFHMPRAQLIFEEAGLQVIPYPVDFRISAEGRDPTDFFPDPKALDRTDIAIRELIGRAFYRLKYVF